MRILAVVIRILRQFISDKRTMALMIVAPIIIL
ncbi:ABC transporter permease, partial [Planococcus sp. SIMBA_143]